jgi:hypothetical protein
MILYEGPSLLEPSVAIVVVATEDSNPKTGRMLFTWILRQDRPPEVAAYDGSDDAICGNCIWRGLTPEERGCYVRLTSDGSDGNPPADEKFSPADVWRKWKKGDYVPA